MSADADIDWQEQHDCCCECWEIIDNAVSDGISECLRLAAQAAGAE